MLSKFHQQAVMAGSVDYFCLACDDVIRSAAAAARHVKKPVHGKNLSGTGYVSVGGSERIRKVKKGYYCEFCNILVATITKTNSHIKEETHLFNKSHPSAAEAVKESAFLRRVKTTVVAFDDIAIADLAWEGIIENSCVVCDVEVDNANIHKSKVEHTLNVIKAKLQIGPDNISRKIDDSTYQCLTCNTIVAAEDIIPHFDQPEHSRLYLERRKAKRALTKKTDNTADSPQTTTTINDAVNAESEKKDDKQNATKDTKLNAETVYNNEKDEAIAEITKKETDETAKLPTSSQNRTMIIESIEGFHKENILIDLIGEKAFCRVCAKNVSFAFDVIVIHIEEHQQQNRAGPSTSAKTSAQPSKADDTSAIQVAENPDEKKAKQEFGKDNVIRFESDGSTFCLLCKMNVFSSLELLKKHVEGHKTGMPTVQYIEKFFDVPERHGVIINNRICFEYHSFLFLRRTDREGVLRCVACQVNVYMNRVEEHRHTHRHERIMEDTPVLTTTSDTSEFIRKVRPDTYHCGFCNQLEIGLSSLSDHLQSSSHKEQKELSTRILQDVLMAENLLAAREQRLMDAFAYMKLFGMNSDQDIWDSD